MVGSRPYPVTVSFDYRTSASIKGWPVLHRPQEKARSQVLIFGQSYRGNGQSVRRFLGLITHLAHVHQFVLQLCVVHELHFPSA